MPHLLLVRHAAVVAEINKPAHTWTLSAEGRAKCQALAPKLRRYQPTVFVASHEPKAQETAQLLATALGCASETAPDLHEHDRNGVGWLSPAAFEASLTAFFTRPTELVFGNETAAQAQDRFVNAVYATLARHPGQNIAIVAHGTVIALFMARLFQLDPMPFWRTLSLPCFIAFSHLARVSGVEAA